MQRQKKQGHPIHKVKSESDENSKAYSIIMNFIKNTRKIL